ncbi:MAG: hypothetical protein V8T45_06795 [Oscillospiraceae bacterium]
MQDCLRGFVLRAGNLGGMNGTAKGCILSQADKLAELAEEKAGCVENIRGRGDGTGTSWKLAARPCCQHQDDCGQGKQRALRHPNHNLGDGRLNP